MKKYYYTNPIAAAWMITAHDMAVYMGDLEKDDFDRYDRRNPFMVIDDYLFRMDPSKGFGQTHLIYIHPDSLDMLKPRIGDLVEATHRAHPIMGDPYKVYGVVERDSGGLHAGGRYLSHGKDIRIIERGGKSFIWPLAEKKEISDGK